MNKNISLLFSVFIAVVILGCTYPSTTVTAVDGRPTLSFKNVATEAIVLIDGLNMGPANQYKENHNALIVEPGTHEITVTENGVVIFQETVFLESEHRTINVH